MPWATFDTGEGDKKFCVFKLDADNNKTGESLACYPTRDEAQTYVKGLYARESKAEKAGARHSANDNSIIQKAHDALCELGAKCKEPERGLGGFENTDSLSIFKDANGKYRWIAFSSSAFRDRDREIVSTKALENDVSRADKDGEYGPLRFWHEPDINLGYTDFNAMEGRVLVESGGFNDERIGARLKEYQDELGLSIGFTHPASEPDATGIYHTIRRFERSIVPADKASNLLTTFVIKNTGDVMDATKKTLLEKLIGPDLAAKFIGQAGETQKAAEEAGMKFKQTETTSTTTTVKADDDGEEKKPTFLTEDAVKSLINKAFSEYEDKLSAKKAESEAATVKATSELIVTLKAIQDGQTELKEAVTLALTGVAELNGALPRKLGEQFKGYVPSEAGKAPQSDELKQAAAALKAAQEELKSIQSASVLMPGDPLAKFTNAIFTGLQPNGQQQQSFVNPNQPQGG